MPVPYDKIAWMLEEINKNREDCGEQNICRKTNVFPAIFNKPEKLN